MSKKKKNIPRLKSEKEVRKELMSYAKKIGAHIELQRLFDKWDNAITMAPESEKVDMAKYAILEVQRLLDIHPEYGEGLEINGELIIAPDNKQHDTIMQPVAVKKRK